MEHTILPIAIPTEPTNCANVDPEIFFDETRTAEAKALCAECYFAPQCVLLGATEEYGVWGGIESQTLEEINPKHANVLRLVEDGLSYSQIEEKEGIPDSTVAWIVGHYKPEKRRARALRRAGVIERAKRRQRPDHAARNAEIVTRTQAGEDRFHLARVYDLTKRQIDRIVRAAAIQQEADVA